jgi:hypothetical protein
MAKGLLPIRVCAICSRAHEYDLRVHTSEAHERSLVALARCPSCKARDPSELHAKVLLAAANALIGAAVGALIGAVGILFGLPTWLAVGGGTLLAVVATIAWVLHAALSEADRFLRFGEPIEDPDPTRVCAPPSDLPPAHRRGLALIVTAACALTAGVVGMSGSLVGATVLAMLAMFVAAALHRAPVAARAGYAASAFVGSVALLCALVWYLDGRTRYFKIELVIPLVVATVPTLLVYGAVALFLDRRPPG